MSVNVVGLLSPGDMGHVVGQVLRRHGMRVLTCLAGRSRRTASLAAAAGLELVLTYDELVRCCDLVLSILVPAEAQNTAGLIGAVLKATGRQLVYVDCNAVAPVTACQMDQMIRASGGRFVDAGIVGPPPRQSGTTRFYASGSDVASFEQLRASGLDVRVIGARVGQASALKMSYAALTKGISALGIELLVAAKRMGVLEPLAEEFNMSQPERFNELERSLVSVGPKARRWVGEMEQIAMSFADLGMTAKIYQGAAEMYRFVGGSPLADELPETRDPTRTLAQVLDVLDKTLSLQTGARRTGACDR